jgi:ArsR family transcriptional regulator
MAFPKHDRFEKRYQLLSYRSKALAHPARLVILNLLRDRPMHVRDIARQLPLVEATVSSHLQILRRVGFLKVWVEGRYNQYSVVEEELARYRRDVSEYLGAMLDEVE